MIGYARGRLLCGHAVEQMQLAADQIAELLAKAEAANSTPRQDGLTIPKEIRYREDRIANTQIAPQNPSPAG